MSEHTKIEWCDHTFNPWIGCTKVSPGCANCYAEKLDFRFGGGHWGKGAPRKRTSAANWKQPLRWNEQPWRIHPNREIGVRRHRVFCGSLCDWLDDEVPVEWLADLITLIYRTPNLYWLLLSKRPENFRSRLIAARGVMFADPLDVADKIDAWLDGLHFHNVWIGTTVENQETADKRIPELLNIPARVRFLSCEPMVEAVDLEKITLHRCGDNYDEVDALRGHTASCHIGSTGLHFEAGASREPRIHWVICGGESGSNARPMHPDWARSLRDQCKAAGVPFFFKQWGGWVPRAGTTWGDWIMADGSTHSGFFDTRQHLQSVLPYDSCGIERVGKRAAGRLLDGVEHNGMPEVRCA